MTATMPEALSAIGACSREEPEPKFSSPTTTSPYRTVGRKSPSRSSMQCLARSSGSLNIM